MSKTAIYRLAPIAHATDPNFDLAQFHGDVTVRARSSGDARLVAAEAEAAFAKQDPSMITTEFSASAFLNAHLYGVSQVTAAGYDPEGERQLLEGTIGPSPHSERTGHVD